MTWTVHTKKPAGHTVSVDLGQSQDYTAICVFERSKEIFEGAQDGEAIRPPVLHHALRHAQRLPLGTDYPTVVDVVKSMVVSLGEMSGKRPDLVVDYTGVGRPVVDAMRKAGLRPIGVTITGGREEHNGDDGTYSVPKRNLVTVLLTAFQEERLKLSSKIPAITELEEELLNFKAKISATGHDSYDAWRDSIHDDLVLSAAIGVWWGDKQKMTSRKLHIDFMGR
jgi:hypothetical protein